MDIKDIGVYDFYEEIDENARLKRSKVNSIEYLTTTKYLDMVIEPNSKILDTCAGGGIYAFYLAGKGHKVTAGDLIKKAVIYCGKEKEKYIFLNNRRKYSDEPEYFKFNCI